MRNFFFGIFASFIFQPLTSQVLANAVAAYPFCGNANDIIGPNNGQVTGATLTADRFGAPLNAYYFNGQPNCYINLGTSSLLKPLKGSISVWARPDTFSFAGSGYALNPIILTKNQPGNNCYEGYAIGLVNWGDLQFHATQTFPFCTQRNISYTGVVLQSWYHIVYTWDNDSTWLYINGSLFQEIYKGFASTYLASDSIMVGNSANVQNNRFFHGAIDDLAIFGTRITQAQVTALYNSQSFCTTGLADAAPALQLSIYPNPVTDGQLCIAGLSESEEGLIEIFSIEGALVLRQKASTKINVDMLQAGCYFVRYIDAEKTATGKFIVD